MSDKTTKNDNKSGQSLPDKTNFDNPSDSGKTSVDSQTPGQNDARIGSETGIVHHENGSTTHTRKYGSDASQTPQSRNVASPDVSLHEHAENMIVQKHGEAIRQNPQFKELVKEEERQIQANADATKGM